MGATIIGTTLKNARMVASHVTSGCLVPDVRERLIGGPEFSMR